MRTSTIWVFIITIMALMLPWRTATQQDWSASGAPSFFRIYTIQAASCNPPDTYTFYPETGWYPSGSSASYPWHTPVGNAWEGFESYAHGALIESSAHKARQSHLEVTSGTLYATYVGPLQYRRAKTADDNFRMLLQGLSNGVRVKWTDQAIEARFYVDAWHPTDHTWQGVHLFARYRTENDLYVASLRHDGSVYIKKKHCGQYTTLDSGFLRDHNGTPQPVNLKQWYTLTFVAVEKHLEFSIDGVPQLAASDETFSWGTAGIRTDYATVYLDDVIVHDYLSDF